MMEFPEYLQLVFRLKHDNFFQKTFLITERLVRRVNLSVIRSVQDFHLIVVGDDVGEVLRK